MQSLCRRYSEAGSCERNRLGRKIAEYAAKAGEYRFDSWYGGSVHIVLKSDPDFDVGVPFKAFDPGYEKEYERWLEGRHGGE